MASVFPLKPSLGQTTSMQHRPLGRTGLMVSNPCLGTMTFGWEPQDWGSTEEEAMKVMARRLAFAQPTFHDWPGRDG